MKNVSCIFLGVLLSTACGSKSKKSSPTDPTPNQSQTENSPTESTTNQAENTPDPDHQNPSITINDKTYTGIVDGQGHIILNNLQETYPLEFVEFATTNSNLNFLTGNTDQERCQNFADNDLNDDKIHLEAGVAKIRLKNHYHPHSELIVGAFSKISGKNILSIANAPEQVSYYYLPGGISERTDLAKDNRSSVFQSFQAFDMGARGVGNLVMSLGSYCDLVAGKIEAKVQWQK